MKLSNNSPKLDLSTTLISKEQQDQTVREFYKVPWNSEDIIKQAAEYAAEQGDILLCATLALLFSSQYPKAIPSLLAEEWIHCYHETLLRNGFFINAAAILAVGSERFESFKTTGQTKTSARTLCQECQKPLLNEKSKERFKNGVNVDFGFWYCDRCNKIQGCCAYCNEPIKGNCVGLLCCGHKGHFGCFRMWFVEQQQQECPLCANTVIV